MKWRQKGIQGCLHVRFHNVLTFVLYLYITIPLEDDSTIDGKGSPINVFLDGGVNIFADKFLMHSLRVGFCFIRMISLIFGYCFLHPLISLHPSP